jgi:PAS domain-containing protein
MSKPVLRDTRYTEEDLAELRRAEEDLRQAEERLRIIEERMKL